MRGLGVGKMKVEGGDGVGAGLWGGVVGSNVIWEYQDCLFRLVEDGVFEGVTGYLLWGEGVG